jgi:hypothetical protein
MKVISTSFVADSVRSFAFIFRSGVDNHVGTVNYNLEGFFSLKLFSEINTFSLFDLSLRIFTKRNVL